MNPHEAALDAIKPYAIGNLLEVTTTKPWGFNELEPKNVTAAEYMEAEYDAYTVILHILTGEGMSQSDYMPILAKACRHSCRVLALEHNPDCEDFDNLKPIDCIDFYADLEKYPCKKIHIDGRNILYVITPFQRLDCNSIIKGTVISPWRPDAEGSDATQSVYTLSSENFRDKTRLLSSEIVAEVGKMRGNYFSVCGGFMFLNALADLRGHMSNKSITLFDSNPLQCVYCAMICNAICSCRSVQEFDTWMADITVKNSDIQKIKSSFGMDNIDGFSLIASIISTPCEESDRWFDIVRHGYWRFNFHDIRRLLLLNFKSVKYSEVQDMTFAAGDIVYTSTIPELPDTQAMIISCYHEDQEQRDIPRLTK